jgi:hypothetical protein
MQTLTTLEFFTRLIVGLSCGALIGADAAQRLEELVARVSLEPGIRTVHWHSVDETELAPTLAVPESGSGSPDDETAREPGLPA